MLIGLLNPVIRGWAKYRQHCAAKEAFNQVDHEIWRALWRWARRRHPKKSRDWVKQHYFPALGNRAWAFACKTKKQSLDGKPVWLRLAYAGKTKIRRHVKIQRDANPFDPQWQDYLKERTSKSSSASLADKPGIKPLRHRLRSCGAL